MQQHYFHRDDDDVYEHRDLHGLRVLNVLNVLNVLHVLHDVHVLQLVIQRSPKQMYKKNFFFIKYRITKTFMQTQFTGEINKTIKHKIETCFIFNIQLLKLTIRMM